MLVGGGSGGHITPLLAVADRLRKKQPDIYLSIVSEKGGKFSSIIDIDSAGIDRAYTISAGKLRRYHGQSIAKSLDIKTILLNIRDIFRLARGFIQSLRLLRQEKPDIIFIKGGFVGVPIGLAAGILRVPYITHDSDAIAGLTNRIIGKKARVNAVGMPVENYGYSKDKIVFVGVPVGKDFTKVTSSDMASAKQKLGYAKKSKIMLITGGSNGAQRLDSGVSRIIPDILKQHKDLFVIHQTGKDNEDVYKNIDAKYRPRVLASSFLSPMSLYSTASDIIVARAGATAITEFAVQAKACIIVPNPYLTGGHQLHNARILEKASGAIVLEENQILSGDELKNTVDSLLTDAKMRTQLGNNLHKLVPDGATDLLSDLLIKQARSAGDIS